MALLPLRGAGLLDRDDSPHRSPRIVKVACARSQTRIQLRILRDGMKRHDFGELAA
jgi:hypothetical protein